MYSWNYVLDLQDDDGNRDLSYRPFFFKSRKHLLSCLSQKTVLNQTDYKLNCEEIELLALGLNFIPERGESEKLHFETNIPNEGERQGKKRSYVYPSWPRRGLLPCSYLAIPPNASQQRIDVFIQNSFHSTLNGSISVQHDSAYSNEWQPQFQDCEFRQNQEFQHKSTSFTTSISSVPVSAALPTPFQEEKENATSSGIESSRDKLRISRIVQLLLSHNDFYVMQSDKGGCSVLWKVEHYEEEAFRHLDDNTHYRPLNVVMNSRQQIPSSQFCQSRDSSATSSSTFGEHRSSTHNFSLFNEDHLLDRIILQRDILINKFNISGYLLQSEFDAMKSVRGKIPHVFFRPKVHKLPRFSEDRLLGRPVVTACSGPLFLLDKYLARLTAPLIKLTKGSLSNTEEVVTHMSTVVRSGQSKCSTNHESSSEWMGFAKADVVALYPSIPIEEGIRSAFEVYCIYYWKLCQRAEEEQLYRPVDPHLFENAVRLIVENSYINFQNRYYYHQEKGIAMGSCISVYLANSYMYMLTRGVVERPPGWLRCFQRYVDDFFIFCCFHPSHGDDHLQKMFDSISNNDIVYEINHGQVTSPKKDSEHLFSRTESLQSSLDYNKLSSSSNVANHGQKQVVCQANFNRDENTVSEQKQRLENISRKCTFLDVEVTFDEKQSKLHFQPHFNELLAPTYLHRTSQHSSYHFRNVPFSQFLRMKKLSSSRIIFLKASKILKTILVSRGYSHGEIRRCLQRAERSQTFPFLSNENFVGRKVDNRTKVANTTLTVTSSLSINYQSRISLRKRNSPGEMTTQLNCLNGFSVLSPFSGRYHPYFDGYTLANSFERKVKKGWR